MLLHRLILLAVLTIVAVRSACPETFAGLTSWSSSKAAPTASANIVISSAEKILLDVAFPTEPVNSIRIEGTLVFQPGRDHNIRTRSIYITNGGQLWIGSEDCPFLNNVTITLYTTDTNGAYGKKFVALEGPNSVLQIHGAPTSLWTHLASTAVAGATTITLEDAVNWSVGGQVVIATTDYDAAQTEVRTITQVSSDKKTLTLNSALTYTHFSDVVGDATHSFAIRAEVGYLTRNILIQGFMESSAPTLGGHLIAVGGTLKMSEVEFTKMGQTGITARYPVHFHLVGDNMIGSWIKKISFHDNFQRCVTIHGTNGILVAESTAYNNKGHCYFLEDGNEENNTFAYNLGLNAIVSSREGMIPSDTEPSIFWITNPNNHLIGNAAAGATTAIWMAFPNDPNGAAESLTLWVLKIPLGQFKGNTAHSALRGVFVDHGPDDAGNTGGGTWYYPRNLSSLPSGNLQTDFEKWADRVTALFEDGLVYKCAVHGIWSRGDSMLFKNWNYADNGIAHQFAGMDMRLQNAVVVGFSQNIGNGFGANEYGRSRPYRNKNYQILGYRFYHDVGPTALANVHFVDIYDESYPDGTKRYSGAIGTETGFFSIYIGRSKFYHMTFNNVDVKFLINPNSTTRGDVNANMIDNDGTITGTCGTQIIAQSNWIRMDGDNTCTRNDPMNSYTCPAQYQPQRVIVFRDRTGGDVLAGAGAFTNAMAYLHQLYGNRIASGMRADPYGLDNLNLNVDSYSYRRNYMAMIPVQGDYLMKWGGPATPSYSNIEWFV